MTDTNHVSTTGSFAQLQTPHVVDVIKPEDIINNLKLNDWFAVKHPNLNEFGEPINEQKSNFVRQEYVNGHFGETFALKVPTTYQTLQYPVAINWLQSFTDEGLLVIEDYLSFDKLGILAVNCRVPDDIIKIKSDDDAITPYFILSLSHDGTTKRGFIFSDFRVICKNTLYSAIGQSLSKAGKFFGLDNNTSPEIRLKEAKKLIDLAKLRFHDTTELKLKALNNLELDYSQVDGIFRDLLRVKRTEDVPEFLDETEKYPRNIIRYKSLVDSYNELSSSDIFNTSEHTGYRVLNAVTGWQKYKGKDGGFEPASGFKNNIFGKERDIVDAYLEELLPKSYR